MRRPFASTHLVASGVLLVVSAIVGAGCGSGDEAKQATTTAPAATSTTDEGSTAAPPSTRTTPTVAATANAGTAVATGRKLDALARAYAPVSARLNFLVTAEVLWRDAIDNEAPARDQRDRAGAVRLEILRMRPLLVRAQRAVKAQVQSQAETRLVQTLLMQAVNNRALALQRLDALLGATSDASVDDDAVDELDDAYRASFDAAARAAREATDAVQELRASLGLPPAPEEALR